MLKKCICFLLTFCIVLPLFGCINSDKKGDKVLIVEIVDDKKVSEMEVVKLSLTRGGLISINVEVCRSLDSNFDEKYTVANKEGNFLITPAILNFIGDRGWKLNTMMPLSKQSVWTK